MPPTRKPLFRCRKTYYRRRVRTPVDEMRSAAVFDALLEGPGIPDTPRYLRSSADMYETHIPETMPVISQSTDLIIDKNAVLSERQATLGLLRAIDNFDVHQGVQIALNMNKDQAPASTLSSYEQNFTSSSYSLFSPVDEDQLSLVRPHVSNITSDADEEVVSDTRNCTGEDENDEEDSSWTTATQTNKDDSYDSIELARKSSTATRGLNNNEWTDLLYSTPELASQSKETLDDSPVLVTKFTAGTQEILYKQSCDDRLYDRNEVRLSSTPIESNHLGVKFVDSLSTICGSEEMTSGGEEREVNVEDIVLPSLEEVRKNFEEAEAFIALGGAQQDNEIAVDFAVGYDEQDSEEELTMENLQRAAESTPPPSQHRENNCMNNKKLHADDVETKWRWTQSGNKPLSAKCINFSSQERSAVRFVDTKPVHKRLTSTPVQNMQNERPVIELSSVCPPSFTDSELPVCSSVHVISSEICGPSILVSDTKEELEVAKSPSGVNLPPKNTVLSSASICSIQAISDSSCSIVEESPYKTGISQCAQSSSNILVKEEVKEPLIVTNQQSSRLISDKRNLPKREISGKYYKALDGRMMHYLDVPQCEIIMLPDANDTDDSNDEPIKGMIILDKAPFMPDEVPADFLENSFSSGEEMIDL